MYLVDSPGFGDGEHLHRTLGCNVLDREDVYRGTVKISCLESGHLQVWDMLPVDREIPQAESIQSLILMG